MLQLCRADVPRCVAQLSAPAEMSALIWPGGLVGVRLCLFDNCGFVPAEADL